MYHSCHLCEVEKQELWLGYQMMDKERVIVRCWIIANGLATPGRPLGVALKPPLVKMGWSGHPLWLR